MALGVIDGILHVKVCEFAEDVQQSLEPKSPSVACYEQIGTGICKGLGSQIANITGNTVTGEDAALLMGVAEKSVRQISWRLRQKLGIAQNPVELRDFLGRV